MTSFICKAFFSDLLYLSVVCFSSLQHSTKAPPCSMKANVAHLVTVEQCHLHWARLWHEGFSVFFQLGLLKGRNNVFDASGLVFMYVVFSFFPKTYKSEFPYWLRSQIRYSIIYCGILLNFNLDEQQWSRRFCLRVLTNVNVHLLFICIAVSFIHHFPPF